MQTHLIRIYLTYSELIVLISYENVFLKLTYLHRRITRYSKCIKRFIGICKD